MSYLKCIVVNRLLWLYVYGTILKYVRLFFIYIMYSNYVYKMNFRFKKNCMKLHVAHI